MWKRHGERGAASAWPTNRHGSKPRKLTLRTGTIQMAVPRARLAEREWRIQLVPRYRRSSREVEQGVLGVYLSGSNTRRIRGALDQKNELQRRLC